MADYDFITCCNWTSTGTFTLRAYRGSDTDIASSVSLFYRKKGTSSWTETTNGKIVISSTGEWEVGNNWNKSGNNVLTHSYYGITAINSCTSVYFNETTLGTNAGNFFLNSTWRGCSSLASMPSGFNLPSGITSVGHYFLYATWRDCSSLASMPSGFNLPSGITSTGGYFLSTTWYGCSSLASMPSGFNLPSAITTVGSNFLYYTWYHCTNLKADKYTENITFEFNATNVFAGTCPITPNSVTASKASPVNVAVNRLPSKPTNVSATDGILRKVTITWTSGASETGGHRVYRDGVDVSGVVAHGTNTYDDTPVYGIHSYTVRAINDTGMSEHSTADIGRGRSGGAILL